MAESSIEAETSIVADLMNAYDFSDEAKLKADLIEFWNSNSDFQDMLPRRTIEGWFSVKTERKTKQTTKLKSDGGKQFLTAYLAISRPIKDVEACKRIKRKCSSAADGAPFIKYTSVLKCLVNSEPWPATTWRVHVKRWQGRYYLVRYHTMTKTVVKEPVVLHTNESGGLRATALITRSSSKSILHGEFCPLGTVANLSLATNDSLPMPSAFQHLLLHTTSPGPIWPGVTIRCSNSEATPIANIVVFEKASLTNEELKAIDQNNVNSGEIHLHPPIELEESDVEFALYRELLKINRAATSEDRDFLSAESAPLIPIAPGKVDAIMKKHRE